MKDVEVLTSGGVDVKASLELFGEMSMYDATLDDFLEGVGPKLERLKNYKEINDMTNYAIEAHSLKSDARYLGFTKLAALAYDHELKAKDADRFYVAQHYDELITETKRIIDLVKKYIGGITEEKSSDIPSNNPHKAILVVDDSDIIQKFIERIFNKTYQVYLANDGKEAIDIIKNQSEKEIVAMLLDLNMPNVDGFEVLEYFKNNDLFKEIPVSIITGDDSKDRVNRAFTYAIVDMIVKPFDENNIKRVIEKTIINK